MADRREALELLDTPYFIFDSVSFLLRDFPRYETIVEIFLFQVAAILAKISGLVSI